MTRAQRRSSGPGAVAWLSAAGAAALEELTGDQVLMTGLPVLMGWQPLGRPHELHGRQLHDLLGELVRLGARPDLGPDASDVVAELRLLAQRAIGEDLTLAVYPD
jgi:hypothetical protein